MYLVIGRLLGATLALTALVTTSAHAGSAYPWRDHAAPFPFRFGNHFDTHQQSRLTPHGALVGYLYVVHTGVQTRDGYAVATHADCNMNPGCFVGWTMQGVPRRATFSHHPEHDHPMFLLPRAEIPQPGAHSHFHWLGEAMPQPNLPVDGYVLQLVAQNRFCFIHHDAGAATPALDCRGNGGIAVEGGVDIATHLNLVPAAAAHGM